MRARPWPLLLLFLASAALADMASNEAQCEKGDARYCNNLGVAWSEGRDGAPKVDYAKAKGYYEKACKLKNGRGCFNVGNVYRLGEGEPPDLERAAVHFRASCELDEPRGCTELAILHYEGRGVAKDPEKTIELFEKACRLGSSVACSNLRMLKAARAR